jgi:hypothetical protein
MFNPMSIQGGTKYVGVDERLRWARHNHPDLQQTSEEVRHTDDYSEFKVSLVVPSTGAKADGFGDCHKADFAKFVQKAEESAVGNALDHLGYSSEAALLFAKRQGAARSEQRAGSREQGTASGEQGAVSTTSGSST